MSNKLSMLAGSVLCSLAVSATADTSISSPHQPAMDTQRNQLVRSCIDAVRDHWRGAGLMLKHRASIGKSMEGESLVSLTGTVWQNGERVEVFHQCSREPGGRTLALYVEQETEVASVGLEE